jgi:acyl-coenzyme A thioesterase PaaI-like protein
LASDTRSGDESRRVGITSPWGFDARADRSDSYAELVETIRRLQDLVACGQPADSRARRARDHLGQAVTLLKEFREQPGGLNVRGDISGRDDLLVVPVEMVRWNEIMAEGTVQFSPFHHGGGGGVHGGVIALLFDDFIGRLANFRQITRTAYMHVNYRAVCPIGRNLVIRGQVVRRERRKMFLSGALTDNDALIADCEGLWVVLPDVAGPHPA